MTREGEEKLLFPSFAFPECFPEAVTSGGEQKKARQRRRRKVKPPRGRRRAAAGRRAPNAGFPYRGDCLAFLMKNFK
uniref:Uncharacterized protein n=1 Tax=Oryza brachyantha TaxID=4533 RepID=J3LL17_ORYBR